MIILGVNIIFTSILIFLLLILMLVGLLLYAKAKLSPGGLVKLNINGDVVEVEAGTTLLGTLGSQKIFLPSACGGGGTCGMCKCQVTEGGGEILPTETGFFNRKQIQDNWRLGCQVKVKNDMTIKVPEEIFGIKKWECEVVSNYNVASFIKEFVVKLPEGEHLEFEAGGYIQIDVPAIDVDFKDIDITSHPKLGKAPDEFKTEWDKFKLWDLKMKNPEPLFRAYAMGPR
jgi:Na+-transporting NADH:ubiquinone oxidoreductase subunit F